MAADETLESLDTTLSDVAEKVRSKGTVVKHFSAEQTRDLALAEATRRGRAIQGLSVTFEGDDVAPRMRVTATQPPINVVLENESSTKTDDVTLGDRVKISNPFVRNGAKLILHGDMHDVLSKGIESRLAPKEAAVSGVGVRIRRGFLQVRVDGGPTTR